MTPSEPKVVERKVLTDDYEWDTWKWRIKGIRGWRIVAERLEQEPSEAEKMDRERQR